MTFGTAPLQRSAWKWVAQRTAIVALGGVAVSVTGTCLLLESFANGVSSAGLLVAIVLPLVIGCPLTLVHLVRVAELKQANQQLRILAATDSLTSCLNRRAFTQAVDSRLSAGGALLVIDADNFKDINDQHGHDRGDEALQIMAEKIRDNVRDSDIVGRIGGEEFGVFLPDAGIKTAGAVAERIRRAVQDTDFAPYGQPIRMSVSIGGACFARASSFSELFRSADQRLYAVKQTGRNGVDVGDTGERNDPLKPVAMAS